MAPSSTTPLDLSTPNSVGQQVKRVREALTLTQAQLGERSGVAQKEVAYIESDYNVTLATLVKVAKGLASAAGRGNSIVLRIESDADEPKKKPWEATRKKSTATPR